MGHILGALGGLLVGLIILAGAGSGMYLAFSKANVATTEENLVLLRMQTQQFFAGTNYDGLSNEVALAAGVIPSAFLRNNVPTNAWGGAITLTPDTETGTFTITLEQVPKSECAQLARFQPDSWKSIKVGSAEVDTTQAESATTACSGDTNTLIFEAR